MGEGAGGAAGPAREAAEGEGGGEGGEGWAARAGWRRSGAAAACVVFGAVASRRRSFSSGSSSRSRPSISIANIHLVEVVLRSPRLTMRFVQGIEAWLHHGCKRIALGSKRWNGGLGSNDSSNKGVQHMASRCCAQDPDTV